MTGQLQQPHATATTTATASSKTSTRAQHPTHSDSKHKQAHVEDEIDDQEKWRLIQESGLLQKIQSSSAGTDKGPNTIRARTGNQKHNKHRGKDNDVPDVDRDFVFEGVFFSIPTTCLFVVMDILVHRQFGEDYSTEMIIQKILKVFPAVLVMVYFSNKAKKHKVVQAAMFSIATLCGCYFLHTMFKSPALGIMKRAPGVITILVYCIVQLNIIGAFASLVICGLYYRFGNATFPH